MDQYEAAVSVFRGFHGRTTSRFGAPIGAGSATFQNRTGFERGLSAETTFSFGPFSWEELWQTEMKGTLHPNAMRVWSKQLSKY